MVRLGLGLLLLAFLPLSAVHAALITSGRPVTFNFNAGNSGPFAQFVTEYGIVTCTVRETDPGCGGVAESDAGLISAFAGLNGTGTSMFAGAWGDSSFTESVSIPGAGINFFAPYASDGVFSLVYTASEGSIEASPVATFFLANGDQIRVVGVANSVPESATLALIGIALAGFSVSSRANSRRAR